MQALRRGECGGNLIGFIVGLEIRIDVVLVLCVGRANRIGSGFGALKCIGDSERNILAVVANDIILERRATFIDDTFEPRSLHRAENLSDILAMKNRSHARHFLGRGRVEFDHAAVGDRRLDGNGVQHSGKVEIRGVLRHSSYLQRAIYARRLATNR